MGQLLRTLALAAIAVLMFGAWMHWQVLDITNTAWLLQGGDWGVNAIGLNA